MNRTRGWGLAALFVVLLALHYFVRPLLDWRAPADFLLIGLLLVAVRVRPGVAALVGCVTGVIADALAPSSFGSAALAMTIVGCTASWLKATFFAENIALNAIFLFAGKLAFDVVFLLLDGRVGGGALVSQVAVWSTLSALVTSIVGVAVLVLFRPFIEGGGERA